MSVNEWERALKAGKVKPDSEPIRKEIPAHLVSSRQRAIVTGEK